MKTDFKDSWPVSRRCEHTEHKRQGRHDDLSPANWLFFGFLMGLLIIGPAIPDIWEWIV